MPTSHMFFITFLGTMLEVGPDNRTHISSGKWNPMEDICFCICSRRSGFDLSPEVTPRAGQQKVLVRVQVLVEGMGWGSGPGRPNNKASFHMDPGVDDCAITNGPLAPTVLHSVLHDKALCVAIYISVA